MSKKSRRKYDREFKLGAIGLVENEGYTHKQAAESLGINMSMLGRWIRESHSKKESFRGNGVLTEEQKELRLQRQL